MAIRDAIVLNTTGSNFEALQSGDSARIKGDSDTLLSIENSSETRVFSVDTSKPSVNIEGNVTSSKVISGSSVSTASFGRFEVGTFEGDAREIASTLPRSSNIISASSQIAGDVSGSFSSGFTFGATADELYIGVSGSNSSHSASISGSTTGMAASGSDLTPLKSDEIGHIRGIVGAGTFTAGAALINGRGNLLGAGVQNAALAFGGYAPGNTRNKTEHFDGTSWSEGGDTNRNHGNGQMGAGFGVEYAAVKAGGCTFTTATEEYNGSVWTNAGSLITGKCFGGGAGTQNAGLAFGGSPASGTCTEHYNGTSWTVGGAMNTPMNKGNCGAGLDNAALAAFEDCTEEYNGTSWATGPALPDDKARGTTTGTQTAAVVMDGLGGSSDDVALHYDGNGWSTGGTSLHNKYDVASTSGLQSAALKFGGTYFQTCTEQYNANYTNTGSFGRIEAGYVVGNAEDIKGQIPRDAGLVTSSAQLAADISGSFTSGFDYGVTTDEFYVGVSGSSAVTAHSASISGSSSSLEASGSDFDIFGSAQIRGNVINGTWRSGGSMITARHRAYKGGTGLENAAIVVGSGPSEYSNDGPTEKYDGTSWSADGSGLNTTLRFSSLTGTQNAALSVGGLQTWTSKKNVEIYNGNVWTAAQNLPETSGSHIVFGTVNAASAVGMMTQDSANNTYVYNFNGTSWSTPSVNVEVSVAGPGITGTHDGMAGGSQNAGISAAGYAAGTGTLNKAFTFDGTTFTQVGNLNTARTGVGGWGTANTALVVGGVTPGSTNKTELWDGTAWTETTDATNAGGRGGGSAGAFAEAGISTPGTGYTEHWDGQFSNSGSFGRIEAGFLHGDAGNIGAALASGSNIVSGSSQLAEDISGSFTSGFNFGASFESHFIGVSGSTPTPGVSGSETHYSSSVGHPSEIYLSGSASGSDYSHLRTFDSGHIRGIIGGGSWSTGASMINARAAFRGSGMYNSALVAMDQFAPHASSNTATEEYEGIAWAAGGAANRDFSRANQVGYVNAAVKWGGYAQKCETEEYNGTVWSNASNMSNGQNSGGAAGTQNAALAFQGKTGNVNNGICTEEYNGTSWSTSGAVGSGARYTSQGFGSQNSAVAFGNQADTHLYDGSAWSTLSGVAAAHPNYANGQSVGTQTGGLAFGGGSAYAGSANTTTFQFDGSVWSSVGTMITFQGHKFAGGAGDSHRSLAFGGNADSPYNTGGGGNGCTRMDEWDGNFINTGSFGRIEATYFNGDATSFSASLFDGTNTISSSAQIANDVSGSFISGFGFGASFESSFDGVSGSRFTPGVSGSSEFYSSSFGHPSQFGGVSGSYSSGGTDFSPLLQYAAGHIKGTVISGAWTVVGSMITGRRKLSASGVTNATLAIGGCTPSNQFNSCTEEYNGSSWAAAGALINGRKAAGSTSPGTQNAALSVAGNAPSPYGNTFTEHYNGTAWAAGGAVIQRRFDTGNAGTENAALLFGGRTYTPALTNQTCTEEYNGTAWSESGASGPAFDRFGGGGLQNAAFAFDGTDHDQYDGTTWSEETSLSIGKEQGAAAGTQNSILTIGGLGTPHTLSLHYDGTTWSSGGSISAYKYGNAGTGLQSSAMHMSGEPGFSTTVEEYSGNYANTGSFGRVEATYIEGDASEISSALLAASPVKTSSEAFQSEISGSIKGGIELEGPITSQPVGAWSQVASSRVHRSQHVIVGTKNSAILLGGGQYSPAEEKDATEIYDGVAWRDFVRLPHPFVRGEASGQVGSELIYGGNYSGSNGLNVTLSGNGTSFNQEAYMVDYGQNQSGKGKGGTIGVQNAALATANLHSSPGVHKTQVYDGNSWSILPSNTNACVGHGSTGVVNAAILAGGHARCTCSEIWDGTSWSVGNPLIQGKCNHSLGGSVNDGMAMGGSSSNTANYGKCSELWDGVAWSSTPASALGFHSRADSNLNSSDGAIMHGQHTSDSQTYVWDTYYATSGSFGRAEPKYGIVTERFELKNRNIDDNNTVLLIHSNTENDSVVFSGSMGDSSLSNHSMSFSGSVKHTSSFAQFGRSSIYFDGDGVLEISGSGTSNRDLEFGSGEFTIEYWVRQDAAQVAKTVLRKPGSYVIENETDVNNIIFKFNESSSISVSSNYTSSVDLWNHVAVVRHEDTLNMYINGKLRDTRANMTESMGSYGNSLFIGDADLREGTDTAFEGYIDEFRISNIARYNTEFIPQEGEIQRIGSGSSPDAPFNNKKDEAVTFKLPQFTNFDQPAILTQTLFQTNFSSSLSTISGSRTGRSGSAAGKYGYEEENVGTVAGDMWFNRENNSLNFTFESSSYSAGAWSAGGDILTPYSNRGGGTGLPDAAVSFNAGGGAATSSINYDGAAWSLSGTMILARTTVGSAGTSQNAAMAIGGYSTPFTPGMCTETETYDGMSWTEVANVITGRKNADGAGAENAALFIGGCDVAAGALSDKTEHYDGSSWSAGGALIIARQVHTAAGEEYNALAIAGKVPSVSSTMEEYNGSVWSSGTAKITALAEGAGDGGVGGALMAGSGVSPYGQTEEYNGVSWKAGPVLITGRQDLESASVGFATSGKGVVFGGRTPGATRATEEYDYSGVKTTLVICALTGSQA